MKMKNFLIINKSPGLVMHPGAGCHDGTLGKCFGIPFPRIKKIAPLWDCPSV